MDLIIEIEEEPGSDIWVDHRCRFTNVSGTPLVSADPNDTGEAIADVYTLTFTDVSPGVSAKVYVSARSESKNPYHNTVGILVNLDGETVYPNIIGGADLVFSDDESFDFTNQAEVRVGLYLDRLREGQTSIARRIRARNDSLVPLSEAKAAIKKRVKLFPKNGIVFERVKGFAAGATQKLASGSVAPYAITVENKTGAGSSITADIKADDALLNVINLTDESESTSEGLNVNDLYRVTDGDLTDFTFQLSQSILNTSTANILIFNASFTQMAEDVDGDPGGWGTDDLDFTEEGEDPGAITAGGISSPIWARAVVPEGANSLSNPYPLDIEINAQVDDGAGWGD